MKTSVLSTHFFLAALSSFTSATILGADANGKYTIQSKGIKAQFIPYGASITNLFVEDKHGKMRDVVLGFDTALDYTLDKNHPHFGGVPGRYANRIKNSTFEIDGKTYHILPNENDGKDTLHGGPEGWDWRNFTVTSHTETSITFSIYDKSGNQGFPGDVLSYITYTVEPYTWYLRMTAFSLTQKTPIMLSSHAYWNLDAFSNPKTDLVLNHTLYMPYSGQRIGVDSILIPTGDILPNQKGSVNDFWSKPKQIGKDLFKAVDNCGGGCTGYDNAWLVNPHPENKPVASLWSDWSGIKLDIYSQQEAFQVYSCNFQNGTIPVKATQGRNPGAQSKQNIQKYGCLVLEVEDWIGGINQPEWGRQSKQIFGPADEPYFLEATYKFSTIE